MSNVEICLKVGAYCIGLIMGFGLLSVITYKILEKRISAK